MHELRETNKSEPSRAKSLDNPIETPYDFVQVRWPGGETEQFGNLKIDQINEVDEGTGVPASANEKKPTGR